MEPLEVPEVDGSGDEEDGVDGEKDAQVSVKRLLLQNLSLPLLKSSKEKKSSLDENPFLSNLFFLES